MLPLRITPKLPAPGFTYTPGPVIEPQDGATTIDDVRTWYMRYLGRPPHNDADAIGYGRIGLPRAAVELEIATSPEAIAYSEAHGTTPRPPSSLMTMFDSVTASDIPTSAPMVAGYIDGRYAWTATDWARFPNARRVRIAVFASTLDGDVLDVEQGAAAPGDAPAWARARRSVGVVPTIYVNLSNVAAVVAAFIAANELPPLYWLAQWDNVPSVPAGFVAKQYANPDLTGAHYDLSVVGPRWGIED